MLNAPSLYASLDEEFGQFALSQPRLAALREKMIDILEIYQEQERPLDPASFQDRLTTAGFAQELGDILCESVYVHASFCRPEGAIAIGEMPSALLWRQTRDTLLRPTQDQEIRAGWKKAFESANEEDEGRLRDLVRLKALEDG